MPNPRPMLSEILKSSEEVLRAYDLKSEIAMICYVLSVEAIRAFIDFGRLRETRPLLTMVLFALFIIAMLGYMSVLIPIYKRRKADASDYSGINVFFLTEPRSLDVDQYLRTFHAVDHEREMAQQIMLLSEIRDAKNQRFIFALAVTFAFYGLMLMTGLVGLLRS